MKNYDEILEQLNADLWGYSELKFNEYKSASEIISVLANNEFEIERGVAEMPTAFVGRYGNGKIKIGFLAEYDALSGLSQESEVEYKKQRPQTNNGHGCGHNLLGTGAVGAALKLKDYIKENKADAEVRLIGCPAEEGGSGKTYIARDGIFDDLDIALTWHPAGGNGVFTSSLQANCQAYFRFHGKSSHAAASPHLGRSAYDAVELMNIGTNYLREHMQDFERVHYAVTNTGGISPNVIPGFAEVIYLIRSSDNKGVEELYERICNIAKGAALMTETECEIVFDKACSNIVTNEVIERILYETMLEIELPKYTKEELEFAEKLKKQITPKDFESDLSLSGRSLEIQKRALEKMKNTLMADFIIEYEHSEKTIAGSSDVGDCSYVVPTGQIIAACFIPGTPLHSWLAVAQGKTRAALKGAIYAADVLSKAAIKLIENPECILKAKEEHLKKVGGYKCPIPKEIKPNQNSN